MTIFKFIVVNMSDVIYFKLIRNYMFVQGHRKNVYLGLTTY